MATQSDNQTPARRRLSGPVFVGLIAGIIGLVLTLVGVARGAVSANPFSITIAVAIGFGFWFLVAWAVASAARAVDNDLDRADAEKR